MELWVRARSYGFRVRFYCGEGLNDRCRDRLVYVYRKLLVGDACLFEKSLTVFSLCLGCT